MENHRIIDETDLFKLYSIYENTYLLDKQTKSEMFLGEFYGDPSCGLISKNNDYCIIGGLEKCVLFKNEVVTILNDGQLNPTFDIKQVNEQTLLILTNPWSENSAIWKLNIETLIITKIRDFLDYLDREYTESVIW